MLCKRPVNFDYKNPNAAFPCGQCYACNVNRRRIWAHRIMLETLAHDAPSSFLTLTYDDSRLPVDCHHPTTGVVYADYSVQPQHLRDFIDRLKYRLGKQPRFYGVGEYGEKTKRPHYHIALFGYPPCTHGSAYSNGVFQPCRCKSCQLLSNVWGQGHILNGTLSVDSAQYIAGYIEKKLTKLSCGCLKTSDHHHEKCAFNVLQGRFPEFSRMSRKPGIAGFMVDRIVNRLNFRGLTDKDDVPRALVHGSKVLPLGRYLSDKIHEKMGHTYEHNEKAEAFEKSLRAVCISHAYRSSIAPYQKYSMVAAMEFLGRQKILDLETKHRIFNKEKRL